MTGPSLPHEVLPTARWDILPEYMWDGLARYIDRGIRPGSFLTAVLSNDLHGAAARADNTNRAALADYMTFLVSYAPGGCFGSPRQVEDWCKYGGLRGLTEGQAA